MPIVSPCSSYPQHMADFALSFICTGTETERDEEAGAKFPHFRKKIQKNTVFVLGTGKKMDSSHNIHTQTEVSLPPSERVVLNQAPFRLQKPTSSLTDRKITTF